MNNKIEIYDGLTYQQNELWESIFPHDEERINFELRYQFAFKKFNNFYIRQKIAAFDMDHTLVKPKNNRKFPKDENDWEWYNESVVDIWFLVFKVYRIPMSSYQFFVP